MNKKYEVKYNERFILHFQRLKQEPLIVWVC